MQFEGFELAALDSHSEGEFHHRKPTSHFVITPDLIKNQFSY